MSGGVVRHSTRGGPGREMGALSISVWLAVANAGPAGMEGDAVRALLQRVPPMAVSSKLKDLRAHGYIVRSGPKIRSVWSLDRACRAPLGQELPAWVALLPEPEADRLDDAGAPVSPKQRAAQAAACRASNADDDDDDGRMRVAAAGTTPVQMPAAPMSIFTVGVPHIDIGAPAPARGPSPRPKPEVQLAPADRPVVLGWKAPEPRAAADAPKAAPQPEPRPAPYFAPYAAPKPAPPAAEPKFQCSIDNEGFFNLFLDDTEVVLTPDLTRKLVRYVECLGSAVMSTLDGAAA